ncbi:DegV family protein [Bacillus sp. AGMB 02131]|uniref:DegV family protein n=1 Tax=Peribacillus faecalis TaxID=2772559 RepID=A0A927CT26_9BACI|nr:DegV family protein [Peribacillus faecalis]MBD3107023.1 DegV family protein [Peribacillus faecalis]
MTKKIAWVTDSTAYIPEELQNHPDLYVVPLTITFSNETYEDGVNLDPLKLYAKLNTEKEVPKTSQPSPGKFAELFEQLKGKYEAAIGITISSDLSGTMSSCKTGGDLANFPVEVVDSKAMSVAITRLIEIGMELAEQNLSYTEIAAQLREESRKIETYMVLGNLDQFYKGGRMSGTKYLIGNLLNIKPIIRIYDGKFDLFEKVRSEKRATKRMLELFEKANAKGAIDKLYIMHGNVLEKALEYKELFLNRFPGIKEVVICELTATISVHSGEGTVVLAWANKDPHF